MEAPKLPTIFKQNRANTFNFKPRYYDPSRERIEKLRQKYQRQQREGKNTEERHLELEAKLKQEWRSRRQTSVNSSNRTLLLIIAVLLILTYYIITY